VSARRVERPGGRDLLLLVSIAHRRRLAEVRETIEAAGLVPKLLTIRPVALRSLLRAVGATASDEVVAYLDVGALNTHIMVVKGEDVRFSREFGVGGATLTEALRSIVVPGQGTVELSFEEAEALKRTHGIPSGPEESGAAGRIPLSAVSVMLRPILEKLVRELWNSFDYCNEQFQGEAVTRVVLLGAGSRVRNLPEYLTGVLKIPVQRVDLSTGIAKAAGNGAPGSPLAGSVSEEGLGLALAGRGSLNFLSPAGAGLPYKLAETIPQRVAAAAAGVLLISVALPSHVGVIQERQRIGTLRAGLEGLRPKTAAVHRFRAARQEETRLRDLLAHLAGGQVLWSYTMRDLSHRVGPDVRLTALEVVEPAAGGAGASSGAKAEMRRIRLVGLLRTQGRRTEDVVGELMQALQMSPVLDQVRLEGCQAVTGSLATFTVSAGLVAGFLLFVGMTRAVYVEPRRKEIQSLRVEEQRLAADLTDLQSGIQEMEAWMRLHPGQDLLSYRARRALPARDMVAGFLRSIVPVANRHHVGTELIEPFGGLTDETVTDGSGATVTYRKAELRFRLYATYQDLGEYLNEIESMEQLVVVRSVSLQYNGPTYPEHVADVSIWIYGTP